MASVEYTTCSGGRQFKWPIREQINTLSQESSAIQGGGGKKP